MKFFAYNINALAKMLKIFRTMCCKVPSNVHIFASQLEIEYIVLNELKVEN